MWNRLLEYNLIILLLVVLWWNLVIELINNKLEQEKLICLHGGDAWWGDRCTPLCSVERAAGIDGFFSEFCKIYTGAKVKWNYGF